MSSLRPVAVRSPARPATVTASSATSVPPESAPSQSSEFRGALNSGEIWWRDQGDWLEQHGYTLRRRYKRDWKPSWEGTKKQFWQCEDGIPLLYSQFMDATRTEDKTMVGLKKVTPTNSLHEIEFCHILTLLPPEERNHCVPILEILRVPDGSADILVMPFLRDFSDPPFQSVGEVLEFCRQLFDGLDFLHDHGIAHRDCHGGNIMMDPSHMYPQMFHPLNPDMDRTLTKKARHFSRTDRPVKYYFIDFGISEQYPSHDGAPTASAPVHVGGDRTVPEFQTSAATHDPFPTDVYYIGNLVREYILQKYRGLETLEPLIHDMVQDSPAARPSAKEVVKRFNALRDAKASPLRSKHKRVPLRGEAFGLFKDIRHAVCNGVFPRGASAFSIRLAPLFFVQQPTAAGCCLRGAQGTSQHDQEKSKLSLIDDCTVIRGIVPVDQANNTPLPALTKVLKLLRSDGRHASENRNRIAVRRSSTEITDKFGEACL
ncbi:hypothetical protein NM688_g1936 [Phlebia brevispora]|uniref:Uncharacterized protein n=1 Tax=Phlebia brevispora TaxID=194682 RepID=A0ACC1TAA5_9APHY|nr:hypothetical protein NM688_g1936 [Phlebia brevispora]